MFAMQKRTHHDANTHQDESRVIQTMLTAFIFPFNRLRMPVALDGPIDSLFYLDPGQVFSHCKTLN